MSEQEQVVIKYNKYSAWTVIKIAIFLWLVTFIMTGGAFGLVNADIALAQESGWEAAELQMRLKELDRISGDRPLTSEEKTEVQQLVAQMRQADPRAGISEVLLPQQEAVPPNSGGTGRQIGSVPGFFGGA